MLKNFLILSTTLLALSACASTTTTTTNQAEEPQLIGMPNPASKYCIDIGGTLEIVTTPDGQHGICTLPDGTKIEEWELFRNNNPSN